MYRNGAKYDAIKKVIIDIFIDYNIKTFPIDEREVCRKMGVALIPYSAYKSCKQELLIKQSSHGFFVPATSNNPPTILYNDSYESKGSQRFTIFHELKHYVFEDCDEADDDLADFFARYFMCPIPYLLLKKIDTPNEIVSYCDVSFVAAYHTYSNIYKRRKTYGYTLFDYEIPLIGHLEPVLLEVYNNAKDGDEV